ncbi:MAG: ATP-binding protein [Thermoanaerobaculia bacterium]
MAPDFERLFESAPSLYLVLDRDFRIVAATDAYLAATMRARDIIGRPLFDVFPDNPDDPNATGTRNLRASLETVLRTGVAHTMPLQKYDLRRPDEQGGGFEERYWSPVNSPVFSGGELTHIIHRVEDVTDFVRLQQLQSQREKLSDDLRDRTETMRAELYHRAQEADEEKLQSSVAAIGKLGLIPRANLYLLLMNAPAAVCIVRGRDQLIEFANAPFRRLTGDEEILGQPARMALRRSALTQPIDDVLRTGQPAVAEEIAMDRDGDARRRFFNFIYQPMQGIEGVVDGVVLFGFDVTEQVESRRRLEELADNLKRADRAKDEFIAIVSHELRTPMTSIMGWARMLELGGLDAKTQREAVDAITRSTRAQAQLIEDLLDESRIASGKLRLELRPLDLNAVVDASVTMIRPGAEARQVSISIEVADDVLPIAADPIRIQQVIGNVLSNAIKFTPEGGRVGIRVRRAELNAMIEINDTGRGMSEALLPYVFDRFRQGDGGVSDRQGGLGLGLAIARHLVELHDGAISATSPGEGQGSTFTIRLPLQEAAATEFSSRDAGRDTALPPLNGIRVLIIEDEIDNRAVLSTVMKQCGGDVKCVGTASAAFPLIASWKPDVLIADIDLPDLDGCTFMERLRAASPAEGADTPALALTVLSRPDERARIRAAGFDVFREKPIDPVDLAYEVARLAASHSPEHATMT